MTSNYKFVSFLVYLISLSRWRGLQGCVYEYESEQRVVNPVKKSSSNKIVQNLLHKLFITYLRSSQISLNTYSFKDLISALWT